MSHDEPTVHSHAKTEGKLVLMANQIATFFKSQPATDGPEGVAIHINKFWEPRMRRMFLDLAARSTGELDPMVVKALPLIKRPNAPGEAIGTGSDAAAGAPEGKGTAAGESLSESSLPENG